MRDESEVWLALLRRKGVSITCLAEQLGITQQHMHELLTGSRPSETERARLENAGALAAMRPYLERVHATGESGSAQDCRRLGDRLNRSLVVSRPAA